jgi:UDPglucose 6-dehydrogenase
MNVTIFGTGYVGLVTGVCFADAGHQVCCVDIDEVKVSRLKAGDIPIYEPGLIDMVRENIAQSRLMFTTSAEQGVEHGQVIFIAVGTPAKQDGSADLQYVLAVAADIATYLRQYKVIVNKSTVPVGTAQRVEQTIEQTLSALKRKEVTFDVCSNPEFLKEGAAIHDFRKPDRIVVGHNSPRVEAFMRELYAPFNRNHDRMIFMTPRSAELTKYAANAMLATKISFINEVATIAEHVGADIESVRQGIGADPRIGYHFIYAGCGYGGSCFPKDVKALANTAKAHGCDSAILNAVDSVNQAQKLRMLERILNHFNGDVKGKTLTVWGLSFKPGTDDVREATSVVVIEGLLARGAFVVAHDPHAAAEFARQNAGLQNITYSDDMNGSVKGADALIICTEWRHFWSPDFSLIKQSLNQPVIFDGRNIYNPEHMAELGISYYGVGRGLSVVTDPDLTEPVA